MNKLEILITSSSRPQLWPFFWESFNRMIFIRNFKNTPIKIHEDFVFKKESEEVVEYIKSLNLSQFPELYINDPAIGLGYTLDLMIKKLDSEYTFYTQEDWEFERPVDLDRLVWVMDNNPHINLIFLNKINNLPVLNKAPQPEREFDNVRMCVYHSWTFLPGLWRTDFVKKHWRCRKDRPEGYFTNAFGTHEERMDVDYCEKNIGAYALGHTWDWRYARHIGNDWRMAEWRIENGQPGGVHDEKRMDIPYMCPWIEYKERPVRNRADAEHQMAEEPNEVTEYEKSFNNS